MVDSPAPDSRARRLRELAALFLKLGTLGFGGPVAHIALMEDEVVRRRQWMPRERFMDLVGAVNLIPGPNSTQLAIYLGLLRAGWLGLIVAGSCFILPAALITGVLAWAYVTYGSQPEAARLFYGLKPAVIALIAVAIWKLGRAAIKDHRMLVLAAAVGYASYVRIADDTLLLLGGALLGMAWLRLARARSAMDGTPALLVPGSSTLLTTTPASAPAGSAAALTGGGAGPTLVAAPAAVGAAAVATVAWWKVGLYFLKVGAVVYGGGFVLLKFLEGDVVYNYGWLTPKELVDAIAVGQITPGPVFSTATFIGYKVTAIPGHPWSGVPGAAAATLGIFLPSSILVVLLSRLIPHLRRWTWTSLFLDAVNVTAVALMAAVLARLIEQTLLPRVFTPTGYVRVADWSAIAIAGMATAVLLFSKVPGIAVILAAAAIGWFAAPAPAGVG